ncbi:RNA polymerase sigma-54 factor [Peribacillus cavernae]|uniref:RNA polymerase sigma-54 factor n=1 Tax=Peribacillus cavernae TaxID=1674310 RepID=A0A433HUV2_9BACI|nr:RNA polymerase factor sigma-54 [Peribacillus cavernae]MDQ0220037.1 RNA polymerase sigma-54 factor [Peribacillus cavernae]RUQ32099.1 RNA polymerase sigma-54 factor [Peribacillus cavernae]
MNMRAGLFQQQTLKLAMTQELSQAIALLQYSSQELTAFLENKSLDNPLISLEYPQSLIFQQKGAKTKGNRITMGRDPKYWIEQIGEETQTLEKQLLSQLNVNKLSKNRLKIFLQLIRNIDENGYLRIGLHDAAAVTGTNETEVAECLNVLHQLEPFGIGARNLQECLLIQAKQAKHKWAEKILEEYFLLFADKKWKELAKKLQITLQEIQGVSDFIQTLNPRPGSLYVQEKPAYIVPDVAVELRDGEFIITSFEKNAPKISTNESYMEQMKQHKDQQVDRFLQEKWQEFQWIHRGVQQRRETIMKVTGKIVERQPECFYKGMSFLAPMTMKEIAEELEIHESTVSRAVKDKYVQAPFGTVEMRAFFTSTLQTTSEEDISTQKAKKAVEKAVHEESKQKPLSDQDISNTLKSEKGIVLSRRTVAKYRDQLRIPSSSKRKRFD